VKCPRQRNRVGGQAGPGVGRYSVGRKHLPQLLGVGLARLVKCRAADLAAHAGHAHGAGEVPARRIAKGLDEAVLATHDRVVEPEVRRALRSPRQRVAALRPLYHAILREVCLLPADDGLERWTLVMPCWSVRCPIGVSTKASSARTCAGVTTVF
jgi:hypothetical protein